MAPPASQPGAKPKQQKKQSQKSQRRPPPHQKKKHTQPAQSTKREVEKVKREVRALKTKTKGPKVADQMTTSLTLGVINGSGDNGLVRPYRIPIHPLLLKPAKSGSGTTPLSIRASCYGLWQIRSLRLILTPLTGNANIAGSVVLLSLNQEGLEPTQETIDSVKARPHREAPIGKQLTWNIPARDLVGVREAWWNVDASAGASSAFGPTLDVHVFMKTMNLLGSGTAPATQTPVYEGGLFLLEAHATFWFANYDPRPALANLTHLEVPEGTATLKNDPDTGAVVMEVTTQEGFWMVCHEELCLAAATGKKGAGEVVWAVASAAVHAAAAALPAWSWLIEGGWWLARLLFGRTNRNGTRTFLIYPSVDAAMTDQRLFDTVGSSPTVTCKDIAITQVLQPNSVNKNSPPAAAAAGPSAGVYGFTFPSGAVRPEDAPVVPLARTGAGVVEDLVNQTPYMNQLVLTGTFQTHWCANDQIVGPGMLEPDADFQFQQDFWVCDYTNTGVIFFGSLSSDTQEGYWSNEATASQGIVHTPLTFLKALYALPAETRDGLTIFGLRKIANDANFALPTAVGEWMGLDFDRDFWIPMKDYTSSLAGEQGAHHPWKMAILSPTKFVVLLPQQYNLRLPLPPSGKPAPKVEPRQKFNIMVLGTATAGHHGVEAPYMGWKGANIQDVPPQDGPDGDYYSDSEESIQVVVPRRRRH